MDRIEGLAGQRGEPLEQVDVHTTPSRLWAKASGID